MAIPKPDEKVFLEHIEAGPFQSGVDLKHWRLISVEWSYSIIAVRADSRPNAPNEYFFRFELTNYPADLPTAQPWNIETNSPLAHNKWATGGGRIEKAFNPGWKSGIALYLPCDRQAIEGHEPWIHQHPSMIWSPDDDITKYLRIIYDLLHSKDYQGTRSS
jgi:hypothetical protein